MEKEGFQESEKKGELKSGEGGSEGIEEAIEV